MEESLKQLVDKGIITQESADEIVRYRQRLIENGVPIIYNLRHLRKIFRIRKQEQELFFGDRRSELYRTFYIPKKSGDLRTIEAPVERLKDIQRWIKEEIVDKRPVSKYATGFRKNYSIIDNARLHVGKELVINVDIKDFFPSISYSDVFQMFNYMGYRKDVAHLLTKLCTNDRNVLPQGAPSSPSISNRVVLKLDKRLGKLAESIGADYSRYADDITFSGKKTIASVVPLVVSIIEEEGFTVNRKKTRLQYKYKRQEVTGLIVNDKISTPRKLEREIQNAIYFINKYGVFDHMKHIKCEKLFYRDHLYGIAYYIHMVDPIKGDKYLRLLDNLEWG